MDEKNDKIVPHLFEGEYVIKPDTIDAGKISVHRLTADSVTVKNLAVGEIPAWKLNFHPGGYIEGPGHREEGTDG